MKGNTGGSPFVPYCFGDGTGAPCPCAFGQPGQGCQNSSGVSGVSITATGEPQISNDTVQIHVTGAPGNKPGLLIRGDALLGSLGVPFADGLFCVGGQTIRSHIQVTSAGSTTFSNFQGMPFGSTAITGGRPSTYQFWYRDPANTCSGSGFNFSNGLLMNWSN